MNAIQVRPAAKYVYDVFLGHGWDNWSRVRKHHWGFAVIGGRKLSANVLNVLPAIVQEFPEGHLNSFVLERDDG